MTEAAHKERVLSNLETRQGSSIALARSLAVEVAERNEGLCSIEDVRGLAKRRGLCIDFSGNWTGAIFRDRKTWEYAGMVQTKHEGGHARRVMLWRLKDGYEKVVIVNIGVPRQLDLIDKLF